MKVIELISRTLNLINVTAAGETPTAEDANNGMKVLNEMLEQWSLERLGMFAPINRIYTLTPLQYIYTIGPSGADFTAERPIKICNAFVRDNNTNPHNPIDRTLEIIPNDKYNNITIKNLTTTYPQYLNYVPSYPVATINLYPVPTIQLSLNVSILNVITNYDSLTDDIDLPPGYYSALRYNLGVELAMDYNRPTNELMLRKAADTKAAIMRINKEDMLMSVDQAFLARGAYNVYTDR